MSSRARRGGSRGWSSGGAARSGSPPLLLCPGLSGWCTRLRVRGGVTDQATKGNFEMVYVNVKCTCF